MPRVHGVCLLRAKWPHAPCHPKIPGTAGVPGYKISFYRSRGARGRTPRTRYAGLQVPPIKFYMTFYPPRRTSAGGLLQFGRDD